MKRILLIDDASIPREFLKAVLMDYGFNVITAVDGLDGIRIYKETPNDFDLSDFSMPYFNGVQVSENIKNYQNEYNYKKIPFIIISAESKETICELCHSSGVDGFFRKGINLNKMIKSIKEYCEN